MSKIRFKAFSGSFSRYWNKKNKYFFFKIFFCQKMFKNEFSTHNPWIPMISWPLEIVQPLFARKFYYISIYLVICKTYCNSGKWDDFTHTIGNKTSFWSATHVIEQEFINNNKVGISPAQIKQNWVNMWAPQL